MAFTNTIVIRTNALQGTDILPGDLGILLSASAANPVTLDEYDEVLHAARSEDLRAFIEDDVYNPSGSTVEISADGGSTYLSAQDAIAYLDNILSVAADDAATTNFGVVKNDENGEIREDLITNAGSPSNLTNWQLGSDLNANGNEVTGLPATPATPGSAASKAYVDSIAVGGKVWKELILSCEQLVDGGVGVGGLSQAIPYWLTGQPSVGQTFIISDGSATETWTAVASGATGFQFNIGGTVNDTMQNLSDAITANSTLWSSAISDTLLDLNTRVIVIWRTAQALTSYDDRIFGTAGGEYVNYNGELDYEISTATALPGTDPGQKEFGLGRDFASLVSNETHLCRDVDTAYTWDSDGDQWQNTGANGIQAGDGLTKVGDVLNVVFSTNIQDVGATTSNGTDNEVARGDHTHAHGDRGTDPAGSQHDADQVDVEATLARIGAPGDAETVFGQINTNFGDGRYVGKVYQYSETQRIPGGGTATRYLQNGPLVSSDAPTRMTRAGVVSALSIQCNTDDATNDYILEIEKSTDGGTTWGIAASLALPATNAGADTVTPTAGGAGNSFAVGDLMRVRVRRTSGSGRSDFRSIDATVEINHG